MRRREAINKYAPTHPVWMLSQYKDADAFFVVNDDDPDLRPIKIALPDTPAWHLIDGFGTAAKDQKFQKEIMPAKLNQLVLDCTDKLRKSRTSAKNEVTTMQRIIDAIWEVLDNKQREYENEITWIKRQIYFCHYGYWCFIHGKPTYIDGWHYRFLNFWDMTDTDVQYRDRDRRFFLFARYIYTTKEDELGNKTRHRTFLGFTYPKHRRDGATHKALDVMYDIMTKVIGEVIGGIQSFDDDNAGTHYKTKLLPAFKSMPFFFKPHWKGSQAPQSDLHFTRVDNSFGPEIGTMINYATTAAKKFYDGKKLHFYLSDEGGKCLGFGTGVLMSDGSTKQVQDIVAGDIIAGDDYTNRTVLATNTGKGEMFEIIPTKGDPWTCNGDHILSLKYVGSTKYKKDENGTVDITVNDFIKRVGFKNKDFSLFKSGIDFPENDHYLDPYFIGIWLGDGNSAGASISKPDAEIKEYVKTFAESKGLSVRYSCITSHVHGDRKAATDLMHSGKIVKSFSSTKEAADFIGTTTTRIRNNFAAGTEIDGFGFNIHKPLYNLIFQELDRLGLIGNKHIPDCYLKDSQKNRLQLLAGLLDTDGHLMKGKCGYEITQKNKNLSYGIVSLCRSLGIKASLNEKVAVLKREGKDDYRCLVYRIHIYGHRLYEVPCKINRKKLVIGSVNKNRDPLRCGFTIKPIGIGSYYGFVIDGNRRFLLSDYTVTHNTLLEDVKERWGVVKQTMAQGAGANIIGFSIHPTTVDDMKVGGGKNFYDLCEESKFYDRNPETHQTKSGLARLYIPAYDGLEGFVDQYGASIIDDPNEEQAEFIGRNIGAKRFIQSQLDELLKKGDPDSMKAYRALKRLFPMSYADCFRDQSGDAGLDIEKLDAAIERLRREAMDESRPPTVSGNLMWIVEGVTDPLSAKDFLASNYHKSKKVCRVEWFPSKGGRWKHSKLPSRQETNLRYKSDGIWYPQHPFKYTLGADPFQFLKGGEADKRGDKSRLSKGGIAVFYERDLMTDPDGKDLSEWQSYRFVSTYDNRADDDDEYAEEVLMTAVFWGAEVFPEQNIKLVWKHMVNRGYGGYMKYQIDEATNQQKSYPGFYSLTESKQDLFNAIKRYIFHHSTRERHIDFLIQCRQIKGLDYMTDYDLFVACGGALLGSQTVRYETEQETEQETVELKLAMPMFDYN